MTRRSLRNKINEAYHKKIKRFDGKITHNIVIEPGVASKLKLKY